MLKALAPSRVHDCKDTPLFTFATVLLSKAIISSLKALKHWKEKQNGAFSINGDWIKTKSCTNDIKAETRYIYNPWWFPLLHDSSIFLSLLIYKLTVHRGDTSLKPLQAENNTGSKCPSSQVSALTPRVVHNTRASAL